MSHRMHVAVIGAGAAGLVTARELRREGLEPVVLERGEQIGGQWRYGDSVEDDPLGLEPSRRIHSSIYASLRTNLPTSLMAFPGLPFAGDGPGAPPRFCRHREVQRYLLDATDHWELRPWIRLGREVVAVRPHAKGFVVEHRPVERGPAASGSIASLTVDAVALCHGHYSEPRVPDLPGSFAGARSHSHNYRRPDPFAGLRVAVLGAKSSGTDLSREIATVAASVHVCARSHDASHQLGPGLFAEPTITRLGPGRSLRLAHGQRLDDVDHLLYCTGYRYTAAFLDPRIAPRLVSVDGELVHPLYLDLVVPGAPRIAFIGLPFGVAPFPLFEAQARWWAQTLSGKLAAPPTTEMYGAIERHVERLHDTPRRHWLRYGDRQFAYVDELRARVGDPPLPSAYAALYRATHEAKTTDPEGYRDGDWRASAPRLIQLPR